MHRRHASCLLAFATLTATGMLTPSIAAGAAEARSYAVSTTTLPDGTTTVVRWDPCGGRIGYRVNVRALDRGDRSRAVRETKAKVRQVAKSSGLRFSYLGKTSFVPRTDNASSQPAQLVVAYTTPAHTDYPLAGAVAGYGGTHFGWSTGADRSVSYGVTSGYVVIDVPDTDSWSTSLRRGGVTRPALVAHELGHAVGLEHVSDRHQLMYPTLHAKSPRSYAAGDRAGLEQVGRAAGCLLPISY